MAPQAAQAGPAYKMLRVPEEDYRRLREAQKLLLAKGLESVNWEEVNKVGPVPSPSTEGSSDAALGLTLGFVLGLSAAALAYLIAKGLKEQSAQRARG